MVEISKKILNIAHKSLQRQKNCRGGPGNYSLINYKGEYTDVLDSGCYAGLNIITPSVPIVLFTTFPYTDNTWSVKGKNPSKKDIIRYINWLLNDSFASNLFITKDPEEAYDSGVIMDTDYSPNRIISAAILLRYVWEKPNCVYIWNRLSKHINGDAATFFISGFQINKDNKICISNALFGGHDWLNMRYSTDNYYKLMIPEIGKIGFNHIMNHDYKSGRKTCLRKGDFTYYPLSAAYYTGEFISMKHPELDLSMIVGPKKWGEDKRIVISEKDEKTYFQNLVKLNMEKESA